MHWLGNNQPKRKRGERGPAKTGADRKARAEARILEHVMKNRPDLVDAIAIRQLGLPSPDAVDPFDRFLDQFEKFRGVLPDVRDVDKPSGIDWAQLGAGIAGALGPILFGLMQQGARPPAMPPGIGAQPGAPSDVAGPAPAAAAPVEVPVEAAASSGGPAAERRRTADIPGPGKPGWQSVMAVGMLEGKTPAEAAAQLASVTLFDVPTLIDWMVRCPDEEVIGYLGRVAERTPNIAGFVRWCAADPEWTIEVVRELRAIRGAAAPSAVA